MSTGLVNPLGEAISSQPSEPELSPPDLTKPISIVSAKVIVLCSDGIARNVQLSGKDSKNVVEYLQRKQGRALTLDPTPVVVIKLVPKAKQVKPPSWFRGLFKRGTRAAIPDGNATNERLL